ncbi:MAG: beta-lactamase [Chitinophagaceae bacterium]|nr:beta-lactamase [Chitinophagaceae bacterium]
MRRIIILWIVPCLALINGCTTSAKKENGHVVDHEQKRTPDFNFRELSQTETDHYKKEIAAYYNSFYVSHGFNGSILVAKNGKILFEDYHGYANPQKAERLTTTTPIQIASMSKTFTGTTILRLWEQGRIGLDDSVQKYIPGLPYHGITIRMLLSHRSGLPEYVHFMDKVGDADARFTNQDVINYMIQNIPPPAGTPDKRFHYCNTNFMLLASIIEKITKKSYPDYMKDSVFTPLGLKNTFVFSIKDKDNYIPSWAANGRLYPMERTDCTYGDKNIYSTPRDIFMWDKALYEHTFVTQQTLDTAWAPSSNEKPSSHNYGLGWRLYIDKGDTLVYHTGHWHGNSTDFLRLRKDTATIIILCNRYNPLVYKAKNMSSIFSGNAEDVNLDDNSDERTDPPQPVKKVQRKHVKASVAKKHKVSSARKNTKSRTVKKVGRKRRH